MWNISPTLRKWFKRYLKLGVAWLSDQSKRPKSSPNKKINDVLQALILILRNERNLGARRIQSELLRLNNLSLSLATIHKALKVSEAKPIKKLKRKKKFIRYQRPIPGDVYKCTLVKLLLEYINIRQ